MRRDKKNIPVFDDFTEARNYLKDKYSIANIKKRALNRKKVFRYDNPRYNRKKILKIIDEYLPLPKYRNENMILTYITKSVMQGNTRIEAIQYLSKLINMKVDRIVDQERKAVDIIKDKLDLIITPESFGDFKAS